MPFRCTRCGRASHTASNCFARSTIDGQPLLRSIGHVESHRKRVGVYVLQWPDGNIYVGKSQDIDTRIQQHTREKGARPQELPTMTPAILNDLESWERNETLEQMRRHGVEKVRGWMYTSVNLSQDQIDSIDSQLAEKYDLCRVCGQMGHFASRCPQHVPVHQRRAAKRVHSKSRRSSKQARHSFSSYRGSSRSCNDRRSYSSNSDDSCGSEYEDGSVSSYEEDDCDSCASYD